MDNHIFRESYYLKIKENKYLLGNYQFRREGQDQLLILNQYLNCYELLNLSAAMVYLMCNGKNTLERLCLTVQENFQKAAEDAVTSDILSFINIMRNRQLCYDVTSGKSVTIDREIKAKAQNMLEPFFLIASQQNYKMPSILVIDC